MKKLFIIIASIVLLQSSYASCIQAQVYYQETLKTGITIKSLKSIFPDQIAELKQFDQAWKHIDDEFGYQHTDIYSKYGSAEEIVAHLQDELTDEFFSEVYDLGILVGGVASVAAFKYLLADKIYHAIKEGAKNPKVEFFLRKWLDIDHSKDDEKKGKRIKTLAKVALAILATYTVAKGAVDAYAIYMINKSIKKTEAMLNGLVYFDKERGSEAEMDLQGFMKLQEQHRTNITNLLWATNDNRKICNNVDKNVVAELKNLLFIASE